MSLFKLREWWSAKLGCEEIFGEDVLAVGNVDNSPENAPKLVTGSVQGRIRVHDPQILSAGTGDATSLLLETRLDSPILQVRLGRLIPNSKQDVAIAVCIRASSQCTHAGRDPALPQPQEMPREEGGLRTLSLYLSTFTVFMPMVCSSLHIRYVSDHLVAQEIMT